MLAQRGLHEFEVCTLGNLAPSTAEEAKALAPSLELPVDLELNPEARSRCATSAYALRPTDPSPYQQRKQMLTDEEIDAMLNDMVRHFARAVALNAHADVASCLAGHFPQRLSSPHLLACKQLEAVATPDT